MGKALKMKAETLRPAPRIERPAPSGESYTRDEWVAMARKLLIREGIAGVKIDRLAKRLGVTRGGFYWRFTGLNDLLDARLGHRECGRDLGEAVASLTGCQDSGVAPSAVALHSMSRLRLDPAEVTVGLQRSPKR